MLLLLLLLAANVCLGQRALRLLLVLLVLCLRLLRLRLRLCMHLELVWLPLRVRLLTLPSFWLRLRLPWLLPRLSRQQRLLGQRVAARQAEHNSGTINTTYK